MATTKKPRSAAQLANDKRLMEFGKSKALFQSADELIEKYEAYLKDQDDTFKSRPPSFSRFADWLGENRSTVQNYVGKWNKSDEVIRRMTADVLFEHTVVGDYRDAPGIFGLKNVAGWTDKKETITHNKNGEVATPEEAKEGIRRIIDSLGGTDDQGRLVAKTRKSFDEIKDRVIELEEVKVG
jgi:hypothetical protein